MLDSRGFVLVRVPSHLKRILLNTTIALQRRRVNHFSCVNTAHLELHPFPHASLYQQQAHSFYFTPDFQSKPLLTSRIPAMFALKIISAVIAICLVSFGKTYAIIGPRDGVNQVTGERPIRQDLSTFKNSGPTFDLYILSLEQFQQQDQSTLLSYYQVAGNVLSRSPQPLSTDQVCRHPRTSVHLMGWRTRPIPSRVLHSQLDLIPFVASALHGALRGTPPPLVR